MSRARALLLALALGTTALPAPCRAEEPAKPADIARARQSFDRGVALFERGEHRAALAEFEQAHALAPSFRILYNIGLAHVALGDAAAAITTLQRYLREGAAGVPGERRAEVEREIARLTQRAAAVIIDVDQAQASISVDGKPLGKSPLSGKVWLNPGRHRVSVSAGGKSRDRDVELGAGDERVLRFELTEPAAPAAPAAPAKPAPAPAESEAEPEAEPGRVPWLAWGVTGALAVGAGVSGVLALSARDTELELKKKEGVSQAELEDARSDVATKALISDIFLGATVVSAGVSLYLTLKPAEAGAPGAALIVAPRGVAARFTF